LGEFQLTLTTCEIFTRRRHRRRLAAFGDRNFLPLPESVPEHDFSFLVFGSIGAPNPGALILLKAKSPPARHQLAAQGGRKP
jgi:hypothetical protein